MRRLDAALLLIATVSLPTDGSSQAAATRLILATNEDAVEMQIGEAVLTEAYRRLNITLDIRHLGGDIALARSAAGTVDGEVLRVDGVEDRFPDLVEIVVPVSYTEIAVYSKDATLHPRDWRDLATREVATVRGVIALERTIGGLQVRLVDTYAELYPLLLNGDVDAIVAPVLQTEVALRRGAPGVVKNGLLASYLLYHYLNRRHAALVPRIEQVLKDMLLDGSIARIRETTVTRLRSGAGVRP